MDLLQKVQKSASDLRAKTIEIRRHLHANPELSFQEFNTCEYISNLLTEMHIPHQKGIAKTGILGVIEGKNPEKKMICLRADLDALPILENNEVSYKSCNQGVMHACGHDVHSASLLSCLEILNNIKEQFEGSVRFIFQPGEEKLPGGATLMIAEGVLENPRPHAILGQHVHPPLRAGQAGFRAGMYMASSDEIYLKITGKGGHAGAPDQLHDPILASAHIITALQQIVSRNASPFTPTVLSFGKVIANGATNVVPNEVMIEGTFRTMNEKWRSEAHGLIREICTETGKANAVNCEVRIEKGYPFLINDERITKNARQAAEEYLGANNVFELDMRMASEDFAWYSQLVPACFYRLGTGNPEKGIISGVHTPTFDIDENALETGPGLMAWLALQELKI